MGIGGEIHEHPNDGGIISLILLMWSSKVSTNRRRGECWRPMSATFIHLHGFDDLFMRPFWVSFSSLVRESAVLLTPKKIKRVVSLPSS
jgi:hypothetical protein